MSNNHEKILSQIELLDIPSPHGLDDYVNDVLSQLPRRKVSPLKVVINLAAIFMVSLLICSGLIYSNESFAEAVKNVPGLSYLVDFLVTDIGAESAILNDYPVKDVMLFKNGDYTLEISNMIIDEERITFSTKLLGPGFDHGDDITSANKEELIAAGIIDAAHFPLNSYEINLKGRLALTYSSSFAGLRSQHISINLSGTENYISDLINENKDLEFVCDVQLYKDDTYETIHSFDDIRVPVKEEDVLKSKHFVIDHQIDLEQGTIYFEELIVSPSKMQLIGREIPNEGYERIGFEEVKIFSESDLPFGKPNISRIGGGSGFVAYQIIPSIYFDDVKELTFGFDQYYYERPHEAYEISLTDFIQETYDYYGHKFTVKEAKIVDDELVLKHVIENEEACVIGCLEIEGIKKGKTSYAVHRSDYESGYEYYNYFRNVGDQTEFRFTLEQPKIIVQEEIKFHVDLEEMKEQR